MVTVQKVSIPPAPSTGRLAELRQQYGCGPVQFSGTDEALYERHLIFDNFVKLSAVTDRERFEAVARSVRDVLSQRWLRTEETYQRENPKRVYAYRQVCARASTAHRRNATVAAKAPAHLP
jgi:hypothetical protein